MASVIRLKGRGGEEKRGGKENERGQKGKRKVKPSEEELRGKSHKRETDKKHGGV